MSFRLICMPLIVGALVVGACAEPGVMTSKDSVSFDDDLVQSADLGAADGYGPYQGGIDWFRTVGGQLDSFTWYHLWELTVEASSSGRIELFGEDGADTYLILFESDGERWREAAYNDDCSSATLDSCLSVELEPGDYTILASTYPALAGYDVPEAGYRLELSCESGGCANNLCGTGGNPDVPTSFVSADDTSTSGTINYGTTNAFEDTPDRRGDRTVEEGDIYRVLDAGTILNLNTYRGLQIIDISDPGLTANPNLSPVSVHEQTRPPSATLKNTDCPRGFFPQYRHSSSTGL